jgi:hypothetical protein
MRYFYVVEGNSYHSSWEFLRFSSETDLSEAEFLEVLRDVFRELEGVESPVKDLRDVVIAGFRRRGFDHEEDRRPRASIEIDENISPGENLSLLVKTRGE